MSSVARNTPQKTGERPKRYLPALTGLRAVAAWLVFIHHFNPFAAKTGFFFGLAQQGYTGVSLFFVLSGFLLPYHYYDAPLATRTGLADYFWRRFIRIYPLLFLVVSGTFLLRYFAGKLPYENPAGEYLLNITLLKGFSDAHKFSGVAQSWSLTVEETFYVLLPALILLHRRFRWFVLSFLLSAALGYGLYHWGSTTGYFMGNVPFVVHYTFWGHSADFFAGFGLFLLFRKRRIPKFRKPLITGIGLVLYGLVLLAMTEAYRSDPQSWNNSLFWSHLLMPVTFATLMAGLILERSLLRRFLASRALQELGKSSYAFYLLHLGVLGVLFKWLGWAGYFLFITVVSGLVYRWVERPIMAFLKASPSYSRLRPKKYPPDGSSSRPQQ